MIASILASMSGSRRCAERVARGLDPLADVGVPEHLHGEVVAELRGMYERRRRLRQLQRPRGCRLGELGVLARDGAREHRRRAALARTGRSPRRRTKGTGEYEPFAHAFLSIWGLGRAARVADDERARQPADARDACDRRSCRADTRPPRARARRGSCRRW